MNTAVTDVVRPRFARMYPKAAARAERRGASIHRRTLLTGLSGRVVEIGAGNGLNFTHYPDTVDEVIAIVTQLVDGTIDWPEACQRLPAYDGVQAVE